MFITMLPEVALDTAESIRRALGRRTVSGLTPANVREAVSLCVQYRGLFRQAWEGVRQSLADGVEAGTLRAAADLTLRALDAYLWVLPRVRESARGLALEQPVELAEAEAEQLRKAVADLLAWLNTPRSPHDPALITASRAAHDRGEWEAAGDVLARLEAGGEL